MTLAEKLNKHNAQHEVTKGKVTVTCVPEDSQLTADGTVTDAEFAAFADELDKAEAYLDQHPWGYGGGYVAWVELNGEKSWFSENGDCEWET